MRFNHTIAALAVIASACSSDIDDDKPWSLAENNSVGENNGASTNNSVDPNNGTSNNGTSNNGDPNNGTNNIDPPDCVDFDVATFDAQIAEFGAYPLVDGGEVYLSRYAPGSGVMWIARWDGESLVPVPIGTDSANTSAIAAEDGNLWFAADERLGRYRIATQETELFPDIPIDVSFGDFDYWAQPRHSARGDSLAFKYGGTAFLVTEGDVEEMGPIGWGSQPWLGERGVSWSFLTNATGGNLRHVGPGLDITLQDVGGTLSWPVTTDKWLFYVHDGRVMAYELGADVDPFEVGIDAACGPLYTDGTTVVTACNSNWFEGPTPPPPPTDYLGLAAQEIWVIDAETLEPQRVSVTGERAVHFPMLNARWIVWVEYSPEVGAPTEPSGQIRVLPRGSTNEPTDIAEMGYGCPYCGAYWPAARLVLDDDTLAWNYAVSAEGEFRNRVGVAQLRCP